VTQVAEKTQAADNTLTTWPGRLELLAPPAVLLLCATFLARQPELRLAVPLLVGLTAVMAGTLALARYRGERLARPWSPGPILAVALLLRLMFLTAPPQLSDDLYRYLWDGLNTLRGVNPYHAAPAALTPPPQLASLHARINHPQYVTIYPPMAQLIFAAGAALGGLTGLKALLIGLDLALCALMLLVSRRLALPAWPVLLYAWNPLPVLEIAGSGHVDGAGLTLFMAAFALALAGAEAPPGRAFGNWATLGAGALLAASCLVKLLPLVLVPVLFLLTPPTRRAAFSAGLIAAGLALVLAFWPDLVHSTGSLDAYARNWEFAGFLFNQLRAITGSGTVARLVLSSSFLVVAGLTVRGLAQALAATQSMAERGRLALAASYRITLALLCTTPTLQPWYALALAALLPFGAGPAGILFCWTVFLTYRVQIPYFILGSWIESPWVTAAVVLAPAAGELLGWLGARRKAGVESGEALAQVLEKHQGET